MQRTDHVVDLEELPSCGLVGSALNWGACGRKAKAGLGSYSEAEIIDLPAQPEVASALESGPMSAADAEKLPPLTDEQVAPLGAPAARSALTKAHRGRPGRAGRDRGGAVTKTTAECGPQQQVRAPNAVRGGGW